MIIGLTGGIASGKSTVSNYLEKKGFIIYDADKVAKEIFETEEVTKEIILNFGRFILKKNKKDIDRKKLKEIVFKNSKKLKILNLIIHPKVYKYFENIVKENKNKNIILDVPLLFEAGIDKLCNKVILVIVDYRIQVERIKKRDNIDEELAKKIISSQLSNKEKIKKSNYIINNNGSLEELLEKIDKIILKINQVTN